MAAGTNWDNSTRNVAKHRVPLVSCERSRGSLRPSSLGGGRGAEVSFRERKGVLIIDMPLFQGCLTTYLRAKFRI